MRTESLPPNPQLFDSMRAVGYSLSTAIADIVDNSISADASKITITFSGHAASPHLAILDNGAGMSYEKALVAMQLAGTGATDQRDPNDLGRFGLGLKTASLSQCRSLTVVSKTAAGVVGLRWDLNYLFATNSWDVLVLDLEDMNGLPSFDELLQQERGTLVVWQNLDRLSDNVPDFAHYFDAQMVDVANHLALVFHRFIGGDGFQKVEISVNSNPVDAADPFLLKSRRTQPSLVEFIEIGGERVAVQAFTLPYVGKMSPSERRQATVNGDLRDSQGFYIYRAGRLVIWGTWFRLIPRADLSKLTRVKVDIPNSLDHLWSLDIKKSSAVPPVIVRDRLRTLAGRLVLPSERVHAHRGIKATDAELTHVWETVDERGSIRYVINRDHPSLRVLSGLLDPAELAQLDHALDVIEATIPVQDIHNRMAADRVLLEEPSDELKAKWAAALKHLWILSSAHESLESFLERMLRVAPFNELAASRAALINQLSDGK